MLLRSYQEECILNFKEWIKADHKHASIILPMGLGKTLTAASCIKEDISLNENLSSKKYLWVAHRTELIKQAEESLRSILPKEAKISTKISKHEGKLDSTIVIGSVQTLIKDRQHLRGWVPDIIIIDEYHHYSDNNIQYKSLLKRWPKAKILGLSATLWRNDEVPIPLGKILVHYSITEAISKEYLVSPIFEHISPFSFSSLKDLKSNDQLTLSNLFSSGSLTDQLMVSRIVELVKEGRKGILFASNVEHSKNIFESLKDKVRAAQIYYDTPEEERIRIMDDLKNQKIDVLCNFNIGTEGLNIPHLGFIAINREIESLSLWQQICGRGLRTSEGKKDCIILDVNNNSLQDLSSSLDDVAYLNKPVTIFGHTASMPKIMNKTIKPILNKVLYKLIRI